MKGMVKCSANYVPLTPISFLERSAIVYRDRVSVAYGDIKYTWKETHERCVRLASALAHLGISPGDVVAALAPNIPAMYELHFGVPMAGAVLCTLNVRHDSSMVSVLLKHSEAKLVFVDYQFLPIARGALEILSERKTKLPLLVLIPECGQPAAVSPPGILEYESLLEKGKLDFEVRRPKDEWDPISLNYTSGTTSSPKGVIYSHRGAYLNSFAAVLLNDMSSMPVYLWCVPMFHCNGWCLTWAVAAQGGTNVCQRNVTAKDIFENIARHKVTHMSGAPTVLNMIVNASASEKRPLPGKVAVMTGGAPPPSHVLFKSFLALTLKSLNRFTEFMVHKPGQGFFIWLLAVLLSPLLWIFIKLGEAYLKRKQPLKKYNMVPEHGFLKQLSSCIFTVLPANFYDRVEEGSLVLKKSQSFNFCKNGLVIDSEETPIATDIVIFATGYKSDEKLKNIFKSSYFQKCITESLAPFYRECIHPQIPQLAILGFADSPAILYTTEMRSKWLAHFLAGKFKLPTIREMEDDVKKWEKCMKYYANERYKRSCISALLPIYCNDQICKDMGFNPRRKKWLLAELFAPYCPDDYKYLCWQM